MLFNSFDFLIFFPIVTLLYFLLPHKFRWVLLLGASCLFYMAFVPIYILIIIFTIIVDYIAGILIENATGPRRKLFLLMSIVVNVGILAYFKYFNFFIGNIQELFNYLHINANIPRLSIILPIGLSFHTFQAMSYTIEVYRGNQKAERHFGIYSLYVMFYPQMVAGPIERPQNLLHQFYTPHKFDHDNLAVGGRLILWGLIKKVVVADRLSITTDPIFNNPHSYSGTTLAIGAIFFAFQIYCDFSGYSDIALGTARVMGFKLMTNFNLPYYSKNISEFWKRWHISLSTWFKDYLYISLGGNRVKIARVYFNLFFVFLVSGFWHGANWTFIFWGALHGFYLCFALFTKQLRGRLNVMSGLEKMPRLNNAVDMFFTFILVVIAWVFFRANNINDAFFIISKFRSIPSEMLSVLKTHKIASLHLPGIKNMLLPSVYAILLLEILQFIQVRFSLKHTFNNIPTIFRWAIYYSGVLVLIYCGVYTNKQFIYFQF